MDSIGQRIEHALQVSGKTVAEGAAACDVTVQAVYAWMRDQVKDLRNDNLFAIADLTGFEARWIGTGKGPERPMEDQRLRKVIEAWPQLDERGKSTVLRVAESESAYEVERRSGTQ